MWIPAIVRWSLWIHSSGSDVIPDMSWISVNQTFVDCPYKSVQLIYPWSEHLLLISPIGNQNSFELKRRIIRMLLSSNAFAWFLPWLSTDTHIRFLAVHRFLRWIIVWLILHIQETLELFPWYELTLVSQILYFDFGSLHPKIYPFLLMVSFWFVKISWWVVPIPPSSVWTQKLLWVILCWCYAR